MSHHNTEGLERVWASWPSLVISVGTLSHFPSHKSNRDSTNIEQDNKKMLRSFSSLSEIATLHNVPFSQVPTAVVNSKVFRWTLPGLPARVLCPLKHILLLLRCMCGVRFVIAGAMPPAHTPSILQHQVGKKATERSSELVRCSHRRPEITQGPIAGCKDGYGASLGTSYSWVQNQWKIK